MKKATETKPKEEPTPKATDKDTEKKNLEDLLKQVNKLVEEGDK